VEVDPAPLRRNLARIRARVGRGVRLLPLVKADAYGTGLEGAVAVLESENPWGYGVATVPEGMRIREAGVGRPVLVMSPIPPDSVPDAVAAGLTPCVSEVAAVERVMAAARSLREEVAVHVEVDTGMGRSGFDWASVEEWGPRVGALLDGSVRWEGTFTHFHSADVATPDSVSPQAERFSRVMRTLREMGWGGSIVHSANSAAAWRRPELAEGLVRPGIFLYGGTAGDGLPEPEDVVRVRARVVLIREVESGTTLGYGATYRAERPERWATLGIGYGDGLPRALGNRGSALLEGTRVPIVGRISMDLTVVDITDFPGVPPATGTAVTLIGREGDERISLEEVARLAGTINYEILTGLGTRLPRVWIPDV